MAAERNLFDRAGGMPFFEALVGRFYAGVAADPILRPVYPEADLAAAERRLRLFLVQYWGGPTTYDEERGHPRLRMRHQPFALWIHDLSAPDPLTPVNLFGLLHFTPPAMIAIGVLPIIMGITMWIQFKLNPAQMDPTQQQIFSFMPWVLMFIMAPYAAGLLLYWCMSNVLTILQQKWLYKRYDLTKDSDAEGAVPAHHP